MEDAAKITLEAKGIILIIGAGVSISAGIPGFRGRGSLHEGIVGNKLENIMSSQIKKVGGGALACPNEADAHCLKDHDLRMAHCRLIADMAIKSISASPTKFHWMLRSLDDKGRLLKLFTQNIDGLEKKVGFDFSDVSHCVALHGSLENLRCDRCSAVKPMEGSLHLLQAGTLPPCLNAERALQTLRPLKAGRCGTLYPDIVLYQDVVQDADYIVEMANEAMSKISADTVLLVVGTSLKIPGVVDMVRVLGNAVISIGGHSLFIDIDPKVPDTLHQSFSAILSADCQEFAEIIIDALDVAATAKNIPLSDLRRDIRPLWDWDSL